MPNWCGNTLTAKGKRSKLLEFKRAVDGGVEQKIDFEKTLPTPAELNIESGFFGKDTEKQKKMDKLYKANIEKYGHKDWYDWHIARWSTKWNASSPAIILFNKNTLKYDFDTAWSPPENWLIETSKLFPDINFTLEYEEGGMGFQGILEVQNGEIFQNETYDYTENEEKD